MNPSTTVATFNLRNVSLQIGPFDISDLTEDGSISIALESPDRWETSRGVDGRMSRAKIHNDGAILTISGLHPQGFAAGRLWALMRSIEGQADRGENPAALPVKLVSLNDGTSIDDSDCTIKTAPGWEAAQRLSPVEWVIVLPNGLKTFNASSATAPAGVGTGAAFTAVFNVAT
jgi:hypothetical protein